MPLRSIPSQLWISGLLACLSVGSILFTLQDKEIPGSGKVDRPVPSQEEIDELTFAMQRMLTEVSDWQALCRNPLQLLLANSELAGRRLQASDARWSAQRSFLNQLEKDALARCQSKDDTLRFCFHLAPEEQSLLARADIFSSAMTLFEVRLDFRNAKQRVSCEDLRGDHLELEVYYTAYWGEEPQQHGQAFKRVSSGIRMRADPSVTASAPTAPSTL